MWESSLKHVAENGIDGRTISIVQDPLDAEGEYPSDPSHALMRDIPSVDEPEGEAVGDLIAECIIETFPARA